MRWGRRWKVLAVDRSQTFTDSPILLYSSLLPGEVSDCDSKFIWFCTVSGFCSLGRNSGWNGQCDKCVIKFFASGFFENHLPPSLENNISVMSNFFKNCRRYSQVKVYHWHQLHGWQICHQCHLHPWQICHWYQWRHRWQNFPLVPLVLLVLGANLPPVSRIQVARVSTTLAATNGNIFRLLTP